MKGKNVPNGEGEEDLIKAMDEPEDSGYFDELGRMHEDEVQERMISNAEIHDDIGKDDETQGIITNYSGNQREKDIAQDGLNDEPNPYDLDDPYQLISRANDLTGSISNADPRDGTYGNGLTGQRGGISGTGRTGTVIDPSIGPDGFPNEDSFQDTGGKDKNESLSELEKDPGKGINRYPPVGIFLMTVMALFYANLFLAFFILVIGPAIIMPELGDTEFWILGGFAEVSGAAAMAYYLILTIIVILCFYKAIKDDGKELILLFSRALNIQLTSAQEKRSYGYGNKMDLEEDPDREGYGKEMGDREGVRGSDYEKEKEDNETPTLFSPYLNNTFTLVAFFFFAVYAFEVVLDIVLIDLIGIERHYPSAIFDMPAWERLWNLPEAPVFEELIFRFLCIGVPLYFIEIFGARKEKNGVAKSGPETVSSGQDPYGYYPAPFSPGAIPTPYSSEPKQDPQGIKALFTGITKKENRKFFLGGGFQINTQTMSLLLFSSFLFSVAHIGWDWTKLIPTFLGGMMLGYLFLRKGLHASILLHFAINSFAIPYIMLGEHFIMELWLYFIYYGSIPFGLYFLYFYLKRFRRDLEQVNLDYRTKEFSRALTATGGVIVFLLVILGIVLTAYELSRDEYGSKTEIRNLEQGQGDYIILEKGYMVDGESINGTVHISGEGELELMILNSSHRDRWKAGEEINADDYLLYKHIISPRGTDQEGVIFNLSIEESDYISIILNALDETSYQLNVTTTEENIDDEDLSVVFMCCFPFIIFGIFIGFGSIYTSNYYDYTGKQTLDRHPGFQLPYPGPAYPPPQGGVYPPPGYSQGQYSPPQYQQHPPPGPLEPHQQHPPMSHPPGQYQQYPPPGPLEPHQQHPPMSHPPGQYQQYPPPAMEPYQQPTQSYEQHSPYPPAQHDSIHDQGYQTHAFDPWAGETGMDRKMNEYPQRDEYRTSIEGDDNDPVGTMEKRDEQFMERIENDKDEVHRPRGNKAGNGLENKDDEEEWIV